MAFDESYHTVSRAALIRAEDQLLAAIETRRRAAAMDQHHGFDPDLDALEWVTRRVRESMAGGAPRRPPGVLFS